MQATLQWGGSTLICMYLLWTSHSLASTDWSDQRKQNWFNEPLAAARRTVERACLGRSLSLAKTRQGVIRVGVFFQAFTNVTYRNKVNFPCISLIITSHIVCSQCQFIMFTSKMITFCTFSEKNSTKVVTETNMHLLGTKMRSLEVNKVRFTF